jgi:ABC-type Fe3+/spermidine/putrescine transport system ATPase subunit
MYLQVERLTQHYGAHKALDEVTFEIAAGERLCLLGPSGCGKTTTLQAIAGFIAPSSGSIVVQGERLNDVPSERRNIGIMFQNYALFPHMSVAENVGFGLRMRSVKKREIGRRVGEVLELVRLSHKASQLPSRLSGGEQQRIAFARAVVIRPRLLLLDEPFSNLDARLRLTMRDELLGLLRGLNIATLMVTHDQEEAMAIGDKIAVMSGGRIRQIGAPAEVYGVPASRFVAEFLGESNLLPVAEGGADGDGPRVALAGGDVVRIPDGPVQASRFIMVRPESMELSGPEAALEPGLNGIPGIVEQTLFLGHRVEALVRCGGREIKIWTRPTAAGRFSPGDPVRVTWPVASTIVIEGAED